MRTEVLNLRKKLHQYPELSGKEKNTATTIAAFIQQHNPTTVLQNFGNHGLAAIYDYGSTGPTIVIRCELDALPIEELNTFEHRSRIKGVSHKCGHDGHMAIVSGLIFWLKQQTFSSGKIVLLFQPAEETGKGAYKVVTDTRFKELQPDYIFALHNIPGESLHTIIPIQGNFSPAVQSLAIYLKGKESHASEPENGINPASSISLIIDELNKLNVTDTSTENFTLITPIYINMGKQAYGISAGEGELHYTLRCWTDDNLQILKKTINNRLLRITTDHYIEYEIAWFDYFPASVNDASCNEFISLAANQLNLTTKIKETPFKFGEDFGWFSKYYKTAMFGIGSGIASPALHHAEYDFPDELLETGIDIFSKIIELIFEKN